MSHSEAMARFIMVKMSASVNLASVKVRHLDSSALASRKLGFSVVAAMSVTWPDSTGARRPDPLLGL